MEIPRSSSIQAVLWDMGGVILRTADKSGRGYWEQRLGLEADTLERIVFRGEAGRKAAVGRASTDQVFDWVVAELGISKGEKDRFVADFWRGDQVDHDLVNYIRSLRPRVKTGLISNAWPESRRLLEEKWKIADAFDTMVISAEVGLIKPDPRIYQLALGALGVEPWLALFIDDFVENIEGARAVGIRGLLFQDADQARRDVSRLLGDSP